jgi:predicted kinase
MFEGIQEPFVVVLVGIPLSGKDTFISSLKTDHLEVISRDYFVENLAQGNYSENFRNIPKKLVEKHFKSAINCAVSHHKNILINATHLKKKRRKMILSKCKHYYKIAIVFPLIDVDEFKRRNEERRNKGGKSLSDAVFREMIDMYELVGDDEGFHMIHHIQ